MKKIMPVVLIGIVLASSSFAGCMSSKYFYEKTPEGKDMFASAMVELKERIDFKMKSLGFEAYDLEITRPDKMTRVNLNGYGLSRINITASKDGIEYKTRHFDRGSIEPFSPSHLHNTKRDELGNTLSKSIACYYTLGMSAPVQLWNTKEKVGVDFDVRVVRDIELQIED